jgi:hypothetical protein
MERIRRRISHLKFLAFYPRNAQWLFPVAWGPLMVGIAMAGVFADYVLRPAIDVSYKAICSATESYNLCPTLPAPVVPNQCSNPEKDLVSYSIRNDDKTITRWVARFNSGKLNSITESRLDVSDKTVLSLPLEYEFLNETLAGVRLSADETLHKDNLGPSNEGQWRRFETVAGVMRSAKNFCRPGIYDQLLKRAQRLILSDN